MNRGGKSAKLIIWFCIFYAHTSNTAMYDGKKIKKSSILQTYIYRQAKFQIITSVQLLQAREGAWQYIKQHASKTTVLWKKSSYVSETYQVEINTASSSHATDVMLREGGGEVGRRAVCQKNYYDSTEKMKWIKALGYLMPRWYKQKESEEGVCPVSGVLILGETWKHKISFQHDWCAVVFLHRFHCRKSCTLIVLFSE